MGTNWTGMGSDRHRDEDRDWEGAGKGIGRVIWMGMGTGIMDIGTGMDAGMWIGMPKDT